MAHIPNRNTAEVQTEAPTEDNSSSDIKQIFETPQALENKYAELLIQQDIMQGDLNTVKAELQAEQEKKQNPSGLSQPTGYHAGRSEHSKGGARN